MTVESIVFWEIVLDGIALLLCGVTVAYLIKLRRETRRTLKEAGSGKNERFDDILLALVNQSEQTFQRVTDALQEEREFLQELYGGISMEAEQPGQEDNASGSNGSWGRDNGDRSPRKGKSRRNRQNEAHDWYFEASQLARRGMSKREIAGKVTLPESEIGLIVDLNTMRRGPASQAL
jgi:hypothetical protein